MSKQDWLAGQFETHRVHLRAVAYRMLGSIGEAEDAVQEAWLRLSRSDAEGIDNLGGWLTTVVARVALDVLRARQSRREDALDEQVPPDESAAGDDDPERAAVLADSVGIALLVVLETLRPAERLAFVLHDLFALSFDEIAPIAGCTPTAARQLASRARRRVQGASQPAPDLQRQRTVVEAFLAASRGGDFDALLAMLDPDVVFSPDRAALLKGPKAEVRGAAAVARMFSGRAQAARAALVDGAVGVVVAPLGRLMLALNLTIADGRIARIDVVADPARLRRLDLALLPEA